MIEVSCFHSHYFRGPVNFTFIKYKKFIKIILQKKKVIIEIENLKNYGILFNFYMNSLLCTEDTSKIIQLIDRDDKIIYGISTMKYINTICFIDDYECVILETNSYRNPLLSQEPKRESSIKKQNKFFKMISYYGMNDYIKYPIYYIEDFLYEMISKLKMEQIIQYEKQIYILCCLRSFNKDIYMNIMKFIKA